MDGGQKYRIVRYIQERCLSEKKHGRKREQKKGTISISSSANMRAPFDTSRMRMRDFCMYRYTSGSREQSRGKLGLTVRFESSFGFLRIAR